MSMQTPEDFKRAQERLRRRGADSLAAFVMSLATESGPVGEQVRTFIVGDNLAETVGSLQERIGGLCLQSEYEHRHALGQEMGARLDFIVDSIERLVLPHDGSTAFELLAMLFNADALATENCGEHDWDVACAYRRAAEVMAVVAPNLPRPRVETRIKALLEEDGYGMRAQLASVFPSSPLEGQ